MSVFDKIASTIMPPESEEDRAEARRTVEACATGDDFIGDIVAHHRQIEQLFVRARAAGDAAARTAAMKELATFLTGHAQAEEVAIYPIIADEESKRHAAMAYQEQVMTKIELAKLELLDPMSQEWRDKLEHIEGAVRHHIYEEEGTWFPELVREVSPTIRAHVTKRFREEFARYVGGEVGGTGRQPADAQVLA
jgi:hemerythrin superfamily protein